MQAFLWRHLVPAKQFNAVVFQPPKPPVRVPALAGSPPKGGTPTKPLAATTNPKVAPATAPAGTTPAATAAKPKFTKQQVAGRLRQIKALCEEGLLTREFGDKKIAECKAAL